MASEQVRIVLTAQDNASAVINNVTKSGENLISKLTSGITQGFGQMIGYQALQMASSAFGALTDSVISFNSHMEQSRLGWATMLGGASQAQNMLKQLQDFANRTPFDFPTVEQGARRLVAMGIAAKDVIPTMTAIATAGAALGLGNEGINRITLALGQMQSKTKVSAEEMLQLTEAGIPAWDILARAMGKSTGEVQKLAEQGKISSAVFIAAFKGMYGEGSKFADLLDKQSQTWEGATSNIRDAMQRNLATAFEPVFNGLRDLAVRIQQFATSDTMTQWANKANASLQALGITMQTLGQDPIIQRMLIGIAAAISSVALVMNAELVPAVISTTVNLVKMAIAFALSNAPILLLAAAIAAVAAVIVANWDDIGPVVAQVMNFIGEQLARFVSWLGDEAMPALTQEWTKGWDDIGRFAHDVWDSLANLWNNFWNYMANLQDSEGNSLGPKWAALWTGMVNVFLKAVEYMVGGWNSFIDTLDALGAMGIHLPIFEWLEGKHIQLSVDQINGLGDALIQLPGHVGKAFEGIGDFVTKIPGAVAKTIEFIKVAFQSLSNIDLGKLIGDIMATLPTGDGSPVANTGTAIGNALGNGITKAMKPLLEELAVLIARVLGLPAQEALEDTQYRIKEIDMMLALRGESKLSPEERQALRRERRGLEKNVLPGQELEAARQERNVQVVTRPLTHAQLQQQIQQNIIDQAKQAAEQSGQAVTDAAQSAASQAAGGPAAPTAVPPTTGAAAALPPPTKVQVTLGIVYEGGQPTTIYDELIEANGQAISPPVIPVSAVRR